MSYKGVIFVLSVFYTTTINAQTCCSGGIPLSNNLGLPILEKGTFQVGLYYDYNYLNTLNNGTENLNDDSRLRITHSVLLNTSYAILDNLSVEGLFTWVNQRRKISQFGNENLDQSSGIGDAVLLLKYNFPDLIGKNSNIAFGVGAKIPLGSTTETNSQGIVLNADLQPGSNAWDAIYWSLASKSFNFRPSFIISTRIIYRSTGTNKTYFSDSTYKFGNEFQAFLNFSDVFPIFKTFITPSISFKYRDANQDVINGFNLDNTGGNWLSVIPNISYNLTSNLRFSAKAEIPIYNNVDGTQLTPTYRLTSGLLFTLNPKPKTITIN
ncbi:transporter [Sabulilitoribacter multivorans]|uniref:Transporter n=1 Tax=Flaviramulus multivorans TaxID=1304750 RepID=A0ABS9IET2_9FLAO|nr:transporter [Flaviramulus multivorans]MCF7559288.1 transporter [Flaviramulus multivorans]